MIHGYTIAINSTNNCDRVPLSHLHYVQYPQKSSTVKLNKSKNKKRPFHEGILKSRQTILLAN